MINIDDRLIKEVDENEMFLLLAIAVHMGTNRQAWPSNMTLCRTTRWGLNKLQKVKKSLKQKGFLGIQKRLNGEAQTSNLYSVRTSKIGIWLPLSDIEPLPQNEAPPLPQNEAPPLPQNRAAEVLTNEVLTNEVLTNEPESSGAKKAPVEKTPKEPWTKSVARLFDQVLEASQLETPEHEKMTFNWAAGTEQHFSSLAKLKKAMRADMEKKQNRNDFTDSDFLEAFEFLFKWGFDYLKSISESLGGAIKFSPAIVLRNYNQILQHARQHHNQPSTKGERKQADERRAFQELVGSAGEIDLGENWPGDQFN